MPKEDDLKTQYIKGIYNSVVLKDVIQRNNIRDAELLERITIYIMDNVGQIFSAKKIADLGIRYSMLGYRQNDIAQLLENVVFLELKRHAYEVYVGKAYDQEIDFIAVQQGVKTYIQVTYLLASDEAIAREFTPLTKVDDNYRKIVVSMDRMPIGNREGIEWMNIIDFIRTID